HQGDVVDLTGGHPGVVGDEYVAGLEGVLGIRGHEVTHARGHRVDVSWSACLGLRDHVAERVEHTARQVLGLAHYRRERGPHQRRLLLVGDRQQSAPQDFQRDRVNAHGVMWRFLNSSTSALAWGPTTVVDSRSSMMAGPSRRMPG